MLKKKAHCTLLLFLCIFFGLNNALLGNEVTVANKNFISLDTVAQKMGLTFHWLEKGKRVQLKSPWSDLSFEIHKNYTFINGNKVFLGTPALLKNNLLYIAKDDFDYTLSPLLTPQVFKKPPRARHIMIDAGHGGSDKGTRNKALGLKEKDLVLDIALRLEKLLKAQGYQVSQTRRNDKFIPLTERSHKANQSQADLFVSIHLNAVGSNTNQVKGAETYILPQINQPSTGRSELHAQDKQSYPGNKNAQWSTLLAYCVQTSLTKKLDRTDRGLKRARFAVLKDLKCPGILVEGGFLTHDQEGRQLSKANHREQMAEALAQGIIRYTKTLEKLNKS